MKKRQKQLTYGQRCRPVGLDAYSLDNVSVYNSVRRKANALRLSKRSYGNSAFEDPVRFLITLFLFSLTDDFFLIISELTKQCVGLSITTRLFQKQNINSR